jgi:hypothetical protein
MRHILKAVCAGLLVTLFVSAAAPPAPPAREADQLDYVFFASDKPVLIRIHLRLGDRPYDALWNDWMDKLFVWFDKDKNGSLSSQEFNAGGGEKKGGKKKQTN